MNRPAEETPRLARVLTRALQALALVLGASTLVTAVHDVSTTWDVWYYHLPFAARLWGIVPESAFAFHPTNQARFEGFPLLAERLQGLFWWITGKPEAANLVGLASLALFVAFLKRRFGVPLHLAVIGLMAIPLVQLHATSCYIDLPANVCASILVLLVFERLTRGGPLTDGTLLLFGLAAAGAANMRFQLHALVLLALLFPAARLLGDLRGPDARRARLRLALAVLALPVVFASPLQNLFVHHNPYYPMKLSALGITLPGTEEVYNASPPYLEHTPRVVRWLYSVLEIGIRPMEDTRRWTIDQWMPSASTGNRMGGFFHAYVVFHLLALGLRAVRSRDRHARTAAGLFAALSLFAALLPQSHELRYYLYWMMVLVSLSLILVSRPKARGRSGTTTLGLGCATALAVVLWVTRAGYVYPSGSTFPSLLKNNVDAGLLARIREGSGACIAREPWNILYASSFHPPARYSLKEAERAEDCGDSRWLP